MPKIPGIRQRDAVRLSQKLDCHIARESGHIIMSNGKTRLQPPLLTGHKARGMVVSIIPNGPTACARKIKITVDRLCPAGHN
jgi:hypothetical protein